MIDVGDTPYIWVNQGWRLSTVLATIGDEALLEYEMPNGSTALRIVPRSVEHPINLRPQEYRNVSYRKLSRKWLKVMVDCQMDWIGMPQQTSEIMPFPAEMLMRTEPKLIPCPHCDQLINPSEVVCKDCQRESLQKWVDKLNEEGG